MGVKVHNKYTKYTLCLQLHYDVALGVTNQILCIGCIVVSETKDWKTWSVFFAVILLF